MKGPLNQEEQLENNNYLFSVKIQLFDYQRPYIYKNMSSKKIYSLLKLVLKMNIRKHGHNIKYQSLIIKIRVSIVAIEIQIFQDFSQYLIPLYQT
ncbi:hypothetical protein pb186bvf_018449 [Paramecium bursaria]